MNTRDFLSKILPAQGIYVLAIFGNDGPRQRAYHTIDEAAKAAVEFDRQGLTVYHTCGSVAEIRKGIRKHDNMLAFRSLWVDIDVGKDNDKNSYASLQEAATAVAAALKEIKLPKPLLVKSGAGLHLYWPLAADLPAAAWHKLATLLKRALDAAGLKQDPKATADKSRVLRPAGTHWRKHGESREVVVLKDAGPFDPLQIASKLRAYVGSPSAALGTPPRQSRFAVTNDMMAEHHEYPQASAVQVAKFCAAIREVADTRGNVSEPHWRGALGLIKYCEEGIQLAHEWSDGHPEYDAAQTDRKYAGWHTPPPKCEYFEAETSACAGCPHRAKGITSPIRLGYKVAAPSAQPPTPATPAQPAQAKPTPSSLMPQGYRWSGVFMERAETDDDGVVQWVPFAFPYFIVANRIREDDGTWVFYISAKTVNGASREFSVPTRTVASPRDFVAELAAREIYMTGNKAKSADAAIRYVIDYAQKLSGHSIESRTYSAFGFHDDDDSAAFVIGTTRITPTGEEEALCSNQIRTDWRCDFGTRGTPEEWAALVDTIYNRPGAEPYQFAIAAAFAAPLVHILSVDSWHGIPIALTGDSGSGKTTTAQVACSIYGDPAKFLVHGDKNTGTTDNALLNSVSNLRHMPIIIDEATQRSNGEVRDLLYALANGKPKDRMGPNGKPIATPMRWDTISYITSNRNVTELLANLDAADVAEATQIRVFEINIDEANRNNIFGEGTLKNLIDDNLKRGQYGTVGRAYVQYLMANRDTIREKLLKERARDTPEGMPSENRERFYYDLIASVTVATAIARKLGFLKFNVDKLRRWALNQVQNLRVERSDRRHTIDEQLAQLISNLHANTLVTRKLGDGRRTTNMEIPIREPRGELLVRQAVEDKRLLVSMVAINEWCSAKGVSPKKFKEMLANAGLALRNGDTTREYLGKGTTIATGQARVLHLNYDRVIGTFSGLSAVQDNQEADGGQAHYND